MISWWIVNHGDIKRTDRRVLYASDMAGKIKF